RIAETCLFRKQGSTPHAIWTRNARQARLGGRFDASCPRRSREMLEIRAKRRPGPATRADVLANFAGLSGRSAESGTARPSFVKTRYSELIGHDDGQADDHAGCVAGENQDNPKGHWHPR
ncbi:MAG: hypothetical protein ACXVHQ_36880, partial [Solirubrobacteraceae bacterium]